VTGFIWPLIREKASYVGIFWGLPTRSYQVTIRLFGVAELKQSQEGFVGGILSLIILGAVAGGIGKLLMPGKDPGGFIVTILLGIAGSVLMNFVGSLTGWYKTGEAAGYIASIIGVIILLVIYRQVQKARGVS
jgi:uncharacterized membrane protein YeaQ/YmgE (transglycosylase-associated protein family)